MQIFDSLDLTAPGSRDGLYIYYHVWAIYLLHRFYI